MDAWGLVESLVMFVFITTAGIIAWLVNYAVTTRRLYSDNLKEAERKVAVVETRIDTLAAVAEKLDEHTASCTRTNNEVKADINSVKTDLAVNTALLHEVKDAQERIFALLNDKMK